ncbi:MAG TPA: dicarboxylate/amino acid:cation symporter [Bacteroidia bacterium]|jgi:Na+/H+-dicarboxylate symporter|nr:dicarboxylate/amino acid:cation symporter [Bacteroidia bacterium]
MKKNSLILWIFFAVLAGLVTGFIGNKSVSERVPATDKAYITQISKGNKTVEESTFKQVEKARKKEVSQQKNKLASRFSWLSDLFLRLIKMIIAPLVFSVLVVGVSRVGDFGSVGRIGGKTILYFTFATLLALSLGLTIVNVFEPGRTMNIELPETSAGEARQAAGVKTTTNDAKSIISHIVPESIVSAMAGNEILPIVVFALFFGVAAAAVGPGAEVIIRFMDGLSQVMFKVTHYVMKFAPVGVFGAITAVVIVQGLDVLSGYAMLILYFFGALLFFIFVILFSICAVLKIPFFPLLTAIREPVVLAFSTASSESAMPKTIEALEEFGCSKRVVSFVLPLGYSFNLDGSIVYMTFATVFIAQAYGIHMSIAEQIKMLLILLVTSKGMAGVPRASLVVIAGMLEMFKIPGQGLLLLLGVDQLLDMGRSATNVVGNAVATAVVSKWEGEFRTDENKISAGQI